ncbi:MAG: diguanylate cyclase [Betaproteobacteria bacterium]|nr:diguanylate cyclase [Betaproteobacteria bacterium]
MSLAQTTNIWPPVGDKMARPLRIMVVDDNVDSAATVGILLEMEGHAVVIEHTGEGAMHRAQAFAPEVCLLDIGLPDLDGYQLAVRLRVLGETAGALMIAMTGYDQPQDRELSRQAGIDHHMIKPIDLAALEDLLKAYAAEPGTARVVPLRA